MVMGMVMVIPGAPSSAYGAYGADDHADDGEVT
jgi:hypothetical protein